MTRSLKRTARDPGRPDRGQRACRRRQGRQGRHRRHRRQGRRRQALHRHLHLGRRRRPGGQGGKGGHGRHGRQRRRRRGHLRHRAPGGAVSASRWRATRARAAPAAIPATVARAGCPTTYSSSNSGGTGLPGSSSRTRQAPHEADHHQRQGVNQALARRPAAHHEGRPPFARQSARENRHGYHHHREPEITPGEDHRSRLRVFRWSTKRKVAQSVKNLFRGNVTLPLEVGHSTSNMQVVAAAYVAYDVDTWNLSAPTASAWAGGRCRASRNRARHHARPLLPAGRRRQRQSPLPQPGGGRPTSGPWEPTLRFWDVRFFPGTSSWRVATRRASSAPTAATLIRASRGSSEQADDGNSTTPSVRSGQTPFDLAEPVGNPQPGARRSPSPTTRSS